LVLVAQALPTVPNLFWENLLLLAVERVSPHLETVTRAVPAVVVGTFLVPAAVAHLHKVIVAEMVRAVALQTLPPVAVALVALVNRHLLVVQTAVMVVPDCLIRLPVRFCFMLVAVVVVSITLRRALAVLA
jgi:hypothetical protein